MSGECDDTNLALKLSTTTMLPTLLITAALYNWYAVDDARSLCPSGWHVPTDGEYMILEMALGMSESEANSQDGAAPTKGPDEVLASDDPSWNGTNTSGFSALAGGHRNDMVTSTEGGLRVFLVGLGRSGQAHGTGICTVGARESARYGNARRHGFSVRCVRDSESLALSGCTDETASNYDPEAVIEDGSCAYGPLECGGASTVTFDGYTYDLVAIGDQCWFAENLRTEHYTNGDAIPANLTDVEW